MPDAAEFPVRSKSWLNRRVAVNQRVELAQEKYFYIAPDKEAVHMPVQHDFNQKDNPFEARWTAQGHTLCLGHWEISHRGEALLLPPKIRDNHMNTFGIFSYLFPDDEDFAEGTPVDKWIEDNFCWLEALFSTHAIPQDEQHFIWFYDAVNREDWRCGSCGGCI